MKKIITFFLLVISTSFSFLIAQENNQITDYRTQATELKSNNLNTGLNCHLMMNPSLEEGVDRLGEALGVFGRRTITAETTAVEIGSVGEARTEIEALAIEPCDDCWITQEDRAEVLMAIVREKVWPIVSRTTRAFIEHPSEAEMLNVRESTTAYAYAIANVYASGNASAFGFADSSYIASADASAYATAIAFATASATASYFAFAFASASAYATATAYAYATATAYASAHSNDYSYSRAPAHAYEHAYTNVHASGYAYATAAAYAYATANVYASVNASANASEALAVARVANDVADDVADDLIDDMSRKRWKFSEGKNKNLDWVMRATYEAAEYARAVANYKIEQEARLGKSVSQFPEWEHRAESAWARAKAVKNKNAWESAKAAAKKAVTQYQQAHGDLRMTAEEIVRQQAYWTEKAHLAEVKALEVSPYYYSNYSDWGERQGRVHALMEMTREKFGSPISPAMKEFIRHPNETTLKATGKSFVIAMTIPEAEEAVRTAEIFAKVAADGAELVNKKDLDATVRENYHWSTTITQEVLEFARAVADFKKSQTTTVTTAVRR